MAFKAHVPLLGMPVPFCPHFVQPKLEQRLREETRIVKMVLSNMSISISSPFSSDLISTTNFRYIKAPRLEVSAETKAEDGKRRKMQVSPGDAIQATGNTSSSLWITCAAGPTATAAVLVLCLCFRSWPRATRLKSCVCTASIFNEQEEDSAFGTYAGAGGKRLVYRERTPAGNYRIIERTVDEAMSREEMLDMRATKKADRHCN